MKGFTVVNRSEDKDAKSRLMAYIRGWSDGAGARVMRSEFVAHTTLAEVYSEGYDTGNLERQRMVERAQVKFGVELSVLRTAEPIMSSDVAAVAFEVAASGKSG